MGWMEIKICYMGKWTLPEPGMIYRSYGAEHERFGAGFLDKTGVTRDLIDYRAPTWSMVFVINGTGRYQLANGDLHHIHAGQCFMRFAGDLHSSTIDPDSAWFEAFVDLGPALADALFNARILQRSPLVWNWNVTQERIKRFASIRERLAVAEESQLGECGVAIQELCIDAQRNARSADVDDPIEEACHLLNNASIRRDNLRDWISSRGYDYEQFRKLFKQRIGISPGQYRIRRRMDRACELLQHSDHSIAAIAYELGYPSPYEFSAQFKKQMGLTPSRYRG